MNDAGFALDNAYMSLLEGITYAGNPVKFYSGQAPDKAIAPYVIIGPWVQQSDNTKDSFGQKGEKNLDIVTRFVGNRGSKKPASEIANQITSLLKPTPTAEVLNVAGFRSWNTVIVGSTDIEAATSTDVIVRKIITISHSLDQL